MAGDMIYKFNYANRLREVLFADGTKAQYVYKSDGMRISRADRTGKTTKYYRDSSNIPEALNEGGEDGNITLNLFPGTGFKSTKNGNQNSTQWRWFITDHLGSVIALTDNNGIVTDEYEYDEYGTITQTKGTSHNPYKYIGQQYDEETGLIYLRARYYDSQTGRFVSRDPIGIRGGINEYGYTRQNPVSYIDFTGKNSVSYKEWTFSEETRTGWTCYCKQCLDNYNIAFKGSDFTFVAGSDIGWLPMFPLPKPGETWLPSPSDIDAIYSDPEIISMLRDRTWGEIGFGWSMFRNKIYLNACSCRCNWKICDPSDGISFNTKTPGKCIPDKNQLFIGGPIT